MVRWIRKADGSWAHDFSIVERYLDIVESGEDTVVTEGGATDIECPRIG